MMLFDAKKNVFYVLFSQEVYTNETCDRTFEHKYDKLLNGYHYKVHLDNLVYLDDLL